jgi:hypothetical protein
VIKTTASKKQMRKGLNIWEPHETVRFNATYDAGVSKIGCFFTIVERFAAGN